MSKKFCAADKTLHFSANSLKTTWLPLQFESTRVFFSHIRFPRINWPVGQLAKRAWCLRQHLKASDAFTQNTKVIRLQGIVSPSVGNCNPFLHTATVSSMKKSYEWSTRWSRKWQKMSYRENDKAGRRVHVCSLSSKLKMRFCGGCWCTWCEKLLAKIVKAHVETSDQITKKYCEDQKILKGHFILSAVLMLYFGIFMILSHYNRRFSAKHIREDQQFFSTYEMNICLQKNTTCFFE